MSDAFEDSRNWFEKWHAATYTSHTLEQLKSTRMNGTYKDPAVQRLWENWIVGTEEWREKRRAEVTK